MIGSSVAAAMAVLVPGAFAQTALPNLHVDTMQVTDQRIPSKQHSISFFLHNPYNTKELGGDDKASCGFNWLDGGAPTCWTECTMHNMNSSLSNPTSQYYARLNEYSSADQFNISIWQSYDESHNTALIPIKNGQDGYYCSHGAQTTQCSIGSPFKPIQVATNMYDDGCEPSDYPIC